MKINNSVGKDDDKGSLKKVKVIVVVDSLLNGINEQSLCKKHDVKVKNVPGGKTVLDKTDRLVGQKPDCIIVYGDTEDITKGINTLNMVKKLKGKLKILYPIQDCHTPAKSGEKTEKYISKKVFDVND